MHIEESVKNKYILENMNDSNAKFSLTQVFEFAQFMWDSSCELIRPQN